MLLHTFAVFLSTIFHLNNSETFVYIPSEEMSSDLEKKTIICIEMGHFQICHAALRKNTFNTCVRSSLRSWEQIVDPHLNKLFNDFKAQRDPDHTCYKEVSAEKHQKNGDKARARSAKARVLWFIKSLETLLIQYFNEDRRNTESGLVGLLDPVQKKEFDQNDEIYKATTEFAVLYTNGLVDTYNYQRIKFPYEYITLKDDPILSFFAKVESTSSDIPPPPSQPESYPSHISESTHPEDINHDKMSDDIFYAFVVVIVVIPVSLSIVLTIYSNFNRRDS
ncbi:hypothetical protein RF11_02361 [Thelohanellus kitauei]|uniref:Uncharacterized protein n=1 Tax=Thelohanellus kitauei TaxID=669202 RepID=A0A0C2N9A8_THEKT|nr:hypothetical protein RF11_02361 [Thelohanellus kitauei]